MSQISASDLILHYIRIHFKRDESHAEMSKLNKIEILFLLNRNTFFHIVTLFS